jgi:hypothetical protein
MVVHASKSPFFCPINLPYSFIIALIMTTTTLPAFDAAYTLSNDQKKSILRKW